MYECEICGYKTNIRSKLKSGDFKGLKVCQGCYVKHGKKIKPRTIKQGKKRKEERKDYPRFFKYHISKIKHCENCGIPIRNPGSKNVAHILPKGKFKSVSTNNNNVMYLCSNFDRSDNVQGCHETFDKSWSSAQKMPIWGIAVERYRRFKDKITEFSKILNYFEND